MKNTFTFAVAFFISTAAFSQVGFLDKSFSKDGKAFTGFGFGDDGANAAVLQPDGKIVAAGFAFNGANDDFGLARYNIDGTLDTFFSGNGKVRTDFTLLDDVATSIALQKNGKIVVAGYTKSLLGDYNFAVARYTTDGALDNTFNADGRVITDFGGTDDEATSVGIQSDGKIVVAGYTNFNPITGYDYALARYNTNGSLDKTFGTGGKVITNLNNIRPGDDFGNAIAIQSNDKIVVAGYTISASSNYNFTVVRYTANGSLDNSFNSDGKAFIDFNGAVDIANAIAIQQNGKIVVAGTTNASSNHLNFAVIRLTTSGTLDNTFSNNGAVITDFGGADAGNAVAIQGDGKIVVAGSTFISEDQDVAIARYTTDGKLDQTFPSSGKPFYNFGGTDVARAVLIQPDSKIVVAGVTTASGGDDDFFVARFHGDDAKPAAIADATTNNAADISEEKNISNIHIYPNPVKDVLRIEGLAAFPSINVTITDLSGIVFQKASVANTESSINVSMLRPGMYNINIFENGEIKTFRFLKQ